MFVHEFDFRGLSSAICLRFVLSTSLNGWRAFFFHTSAISILSFDYTDKKKIKFSSYIRKFRMEQLQSHI
jgi:hypothetical protein